jgi:hypothetical protein
LACNGQNAEHLSRRPHPPAVDAPALERLGVSLLRHEPEGNVEPGNADLQKLALTGELVKRHGENRFEVMIRDDRP